MKPNEPKSSAAAACPASARNTREGGGWGESKTREGGREKEQDERDRVESAKNRAKIHVGHSNSPASLFPLPPPPASSSSPYFFFSFYKAFICSLL